MKTNLRRLLFLVFLAVSVMQGAEANPPVIVGRGPHSREWQRTFQEMLPNGKVRTRVSGFTELASGMHRWDIPTGQSAVLILTSEGEGDGRNGEGV